MSSAMLIAEMVHVLAHAHVDGDCDWLRTWLSVKTLVAKVSISSNSLAVLRLVQLSKKKRRKKEGSLIVPQGQVLVECVVFVWQPSLNAVAW